MCPTISISYNAHFASHSVDTYLIFIKKYICFIPYLLLILLSVLKVQMIFKIEQQLQNFYVSKFFDHVFLAR